MIWKTPPDLDALNEMSRDSLVTHLGIVFTYADERTLHATMPVDNRTHQPFGLLHGGASVVLAETLGSTAAGLVIGNGGRCVGLDINANHVRGKRSGLVTGIAEPRHIGRRTHVWQIEINDEREQLICTSRLTMAILSAP